MGWRQFLNGTDLGLEKVKCEEFNDFMQLQFNQTTSILN